MILADGSLVADLLDKPEEEMEKDVDGEDCGGDGSEEWVAVEVLPVRVDRVVLLSEGVGLCLNE